LADDCQARAETLKGWVFRVAMNEALARKRRAKIGDAAHRKAAWTMPVNGRPPDEAAIRGETIDKVRAAIQRLPGEQQAVVHSRIYEDKPFAEIAGELKVPLGTVLTRMRLALEKLRRSLQPGEES
ncbi:MAG: RNA polymerase sigma factor, partial [Planctomycetia bacterium]